MMERDRKGLYAKVQVGVFKIFPVELPKNF